MKDAVECETWNEGLPLVLETPTLLFSGPGFVEVGSQQKEKQLGLSGSLSRERERERKRGEMRGKREEWGERKEERDTHRESCTFWKKTAHLAWRLAQEGTISAFINIPSLQPEIMRFFVRLKEPESNLIIVFEDFRKKQLFSLSWWANQGLKWCFWSWHGAIQAWAGRGVMIKACIWAEIVSKDQTPSLPYHFFITLNSICVAIVRQEVICQVIYESEIHRIVLEMYQKSCSGFWEKIFQNFHPLWSIGVQKKKKRVLSLCTIISPNAKCLCNDVPWLNISERRKGWSLAIKPQCKDIF